VQYLKEIGSDEAIAPSNLPGGVVAAYGFNEGAGTTLTDLSGNGNNGTISSATWTAAGKYGNALVFNGTNAQVTVPNSTSLQLTTGMTLEAWVFPTTTPTGWRAVIDKNVDGYFLMASTDLGNRPSVGGTWVAGSQNTFGPSVLAVNAWTHLAATFDGATVRLYVNGVQVASQAQTTALTTTNGTLQIGGDAYPGEFFAGRIDEVRIYNRALSAAEITTDMNTPLAPVVDTTPPVLSNAQPSGTLAVGTTQTTLSVTSNENATCRYASTAGTAYGSMTNTFGTTGGTAHSTLVSGLANGQSYSYYVRCQDTAGNPDTVDLTISFSVAAPDTTPPTVSVSAPATGATVSGTVSVSASASDNVGVVGVQFLLDGANLGAEVTTAPYTVSWNTAGATNGAHTLSARARDAAGNQTTSSAVSVTVSNAAPSGLVAALNFNEGSGTTAADTSGNGHAATLINGPTWSAGQYGSAINFDGVNDLLTVANSTTLNFGTADFTLMMWVKRNALGGTAQRHLFSKCLTSTSVWEIGCKEFYFAGNVLRFGSFATGDTTSVSVVDANWHHIALVFTRASSLVQIYVDGTLRTSATKNLEADNPAHTVVIGNHLNGNPFSGVIDEVRIYNQALTAAQVTTDMNTPLAPLVDTTPPTVTSTTPANGATGFSRTANITATFSEAMSATSINSTTIELRDPTNALVPATVTLDPTPTLGATATYTVTVKGGIADPSVKDTAGNPLATNRVWTFTTR
jgi:Concanavalin A-like lectin/glucanases superfamily/Bacterial Ig-like domain/Bacterial Ig domain